MSTMHLTDSSSSRYIVGIDLGTTNSAVAYFDTEKRKIQAFHIAQLGKYGHEESLPFLPSFLYLDESKKYVAGMWAKTQGAQTPTRLIQSAKSWLCNPLANRKEKILPYESADVSKKLTPVEASAQYLTHIREMWNQQFAKKDSAFELEEQEIILTIPASFDEVARSLTVEAAHMAGLKRLTLLEEPQAAFYSWLMENRKESFQPGESILVCDVGGGTTDFSLIDVIAGEDGEIQLRRMAVGKHLLLGGDNMDAALCHALEKKLGKELEISQHLSLLHQIHLAKEMLFSGKEEGGYNIYVPGQGSQVVGGGIAVKLEYAEAEHILLEGFFGLYSFDEALRLEKSSGIRQMGLAFETEPSITKHLAHFLNKNGCSKKPKYLLFNGGALKPKIFQDRIVASLDLWFGKEPSVQLLSSSSLDLAVARGAAFFGQARQQKKDLIGGGVPRTYYLEIGGKALTLLPRGTPEGTKVTSEQLFHLIPNQPVGFQLYYSQTRLHDESGHLVDIEEEEMTQLPLLHTICKYGKKDHQEPIPVHLDMHLTPIGILELWLLAKDTPHKWKLEFQLRGEKQDDRLVDETLDMGALASAQQSIVEAFSVGQHQKLNTLMSDLEDLLDKDRRQWSPSVLRALFESLMSQSDKRLLSTAYEGRFWNLAGFFLRPGIGYPLDDFRIKQLWKLILADHKKQKHEDVQLQQWICFRRIAAGLSKGQQTELFKDLEKVKHKKKDGYPYAEHLRALASFELVDTGLKIKWGNALMHKIVSGKGEPCDYWALGRFGARHLFYGSAANVVSRTTCEEWVRTLIEKPLARHTHLPFALAMLARKTGDRLLDLPSSLLDQVAPLAADLQDLLLQERTLTLQEQERFFGDSLPSGLILQ